MDVPPGTRLGRYEIRAPLGAGGMGEVYLACDTTLRRDVAVKLLPGHLAANPDYLRRIEQEARTASSLNHPNILTVHEIGTQGGTTFIATEFIDGESLRHRMRRDRLDLRNILDIGTQVASALATAHAAGVVHRDIKPENLMIRKDGIVKVLDFGLAKIVGGNTPDPDAQTVASFNTAPGVVVGTVQYMSPEQARGLGTDPRTDVWSLGVVLYELLAGRSTFEGRTASDVIAAILRTDPPPLTRYAEDVPPELQRIVSKAIQKDRDERYQAIRDLELDLKALRRQLDFEAERVRQGSTPAASAPTPGRRAWRSPALLVPLVVLTTAVLAYGVYGNFIRPSVGREVNSIAVLPFTNESGDPDVEYISDGVTAGLINSLSAMASLKVISRASVFRYKGREVDPQEVARSLGVQAIVIGRVTQRGDSLSIWAELVDVEDRTQLWGEEYKRNAADLLQMQADIAGEIANTLRLHLSAGERDRLTKRETGNPQAYDLVLRGRFYFDKGGTQNRKTAIEHYQRAIRIEPDYALAYVLLADAYQYLVFLSVVSPDEYLPKAEAAVRKALELDDSLAEAHNMLARTKRARWDWAGAEASFKRALALNPNLADAHESYAGYLTVVGRFDEAVAEGRRAQELDPLSIGVASRMGLMLLFARRHDEAIEGLKQVLATDPHNSAAYLFLGYNYAAKGLHSEALSAYQEAIRLGDDSASAQIYLGTAHANLGDRLPAQGIRTRLEKGNSYVSPGELAILYAALGQKEQAFASLEKAFAQRDVQLIFLGCDPAFDSLRDDARFANLMRRMGLQPIARPTASTR